MFNDRRQWPPNDLCWTVYANPVGQHIRNSRASEVWDPNWNVVHPSEAWLFSQWRRWIGFGWHSGHDSKLHRLGASRYKDVFPVYDSHYKYNTVSWSSYLYDRNSIYRKTVFILRQGPGPLWTYWLQHILCFWFSDKYQTNDLTSILNHELVSYFGHSVLRAQPAQLFQ